MDVTSTSSPTTASEDARTSAVDGSTAPLRGAVAEGEMLDVVHSSPAATSVNGSDPVLGPWSAEHDAVLSSLVAANTFAVPWPTLRAILKRKVELNVEAFLAQPSHSAEAIAASRAGTVAAASAPGADAGQSGAEGKEIGPPAPAAVQDGPSSGAGPRQAADDRPSAPKPAATAGSGQPATTDGPAPEEETAEARVNPGWLIGGRTLPAYITRDEADVLERRIGRLLDSFESNPPFTVQRLAELVSAPEASHGSLGKHLRAILRVLDVHSEWTPPASVIPGGSTAGRSTSATGIGGETPHAVVPGGTAWSVGTPLFSPIPFLARDELEGAGAAEPAPSPMSLGSPLPIRSSPPSGPALPLPTAVIDPPSSSSSTAAPPSLPTPVTADGSSGHAPKTLSSDELIVDELDAGLALPSSSSSTNLTSAVGGASDGTSPGGMSTAAHEGEGANQHAHLLASSPRAFTTTTTTTAGGTPLTPPTSRIRPREEDDIEMPGPDDEPEERFVRSKSPTPDIGRVEVTPGAAVPAVDSQPPPSSGSAAAAS